MKTCPTRCLLCGAHDNYTVLYPANFTEQDLNEAVFSARRLPDRVHYQVVRCNADGLVRSNPVLPAEDAARLYRESKCNYGDEVAALTRTYVTALEEALKGLSPEARILEVGCGNGFVLKGLKERGFGNVHGVEPSADAVAKADDSIRAGIVRDIFRPGLFPQAHFDIICCFQTMDHLHDPAAFMDECRALLKHGGKLVLFQHDSDSWSAKLLGEQSPIIDIEHIYLFNARTIRAFAEARGLTVLQVYSPSNILSLRHLIWLMPLPKGMKARVCGSGSALFRKTVRLRLGNLCMIAQKE